MENKNLKFNAFVDLGILKFIIEGVSLHCLHEPPMAGCDEEYFIDILKKLGWELDESDYDGIIDKEGNKIELHKNGVLYGEEYFFFEKCKIMQVIGLKDKFEKEIFSGDIVAIIYDKSPVDQDEKGEMKEVNPAVGVVSWDEHSTGWVLKTKSPMSVNEEGTVMTSIIHGRNGERIKLGNIHLNPELFV